jgi:hypothetical protein
MPQIEISDFDYEIRVTRNGVTRVYPFNLFTPTAGQQRLYALLDRTAGNWNCEPYTFTCEGTTHTAARSKRWKLKGGDGC